MVIIFLVVSLHKNSIFTISKEYIKLIPLKISNIISKLFEKAIDQGDTNVMWLE